MLLLNIIRKLTGFFSSTSHVYSLQNKKIKENFKTNPSSKYGKTKL